MFFLFKKLFALLVTPLGISLLLLLLALVYFYKKPQRSFKFLIAGISVLFISSFPPFAHLVLSPIEYAYPAYHKTSKPVDYIAVLGCSHTTNSNIPVLSQLRACSLERISEAVRIANLHPEAKIITSGYFGHQAVSHAQMVGRAAIELGIAKERIIIENFAQDTEEEAIQIAQRSKNKNLILVTNASHMMRAMRYFKTAGITPIPAPAGHLTTLNSHTNSKATEQPFDYGYYIPSARALEKTSIALYERLSQAWQWLKS